MCIMKLYVHGLIELIYELIRPFHLSSSPAEPFQLSSSQAEPCQMSSYSSQANPMSRALRFGFHWGSLCHVTVELLSQAPTGVHRTSFCPVLGLGNYTMVPKSLVLGEREGSGVCQTTTAVSGNPGLSPHYVCMFMILNSNLQLFTPRRC